MVKNIVGFGVLTLPAGTERLSDNGMSSTEAVAVSVALLILFGAIEAWTFVLVGEACEQLGVSSYAAAWQQTLGPRTS